MASITFVDAVAAAVEFLSRPLATSCAAVTLARLQKELQIQLLKHFAPRSLGGGSRRGLLFTPSTPPRPVRDACVAAGLPVTWSSWFARLVGGAEFELFVGAAAVTITPSGSMSVTLWTPKPKFEDVLLVSDEADDDDLFAAIEAQRHQQWLSSTLAAFPRVPGQLAVPAQSAFRGHSRSASFSSIASTSSIASSSTASGASFSSVDTASSRSSSPAASPVCDSAAPLPEVYVDRSKTEIARYDGGKTNVLTGGVMLGAKPAAPKPAAPMLAPTQRAPAPATWWRSPRA
jgi:hypothetical protein